MAAFGNLLPITVGVELFRDILIYNKILAVERLSMLGAYFVLALGAAYIQMKKELLK